MLKRLLAYLGLAPSAPPVKPKVVQVAVDYPDENLGLTDDELNRLQNTKTCEFCGGIHEQACPRVKRIVYTEKGDPHEIEFWRDDQWPRDNILFPSEIEGYNYHADE